MKTPEHPKLERRERKRQRKLSNARKKQINKIQDGCLVDHLDLESGSSSVYSSPCTSEISSLGSDTSGEVNVVLNSEVDISEVEGAFTKNPIALDCEMVGVGDEKRSALARCSIVNYEGNVIYDVYVKPDQQITDYRTQWSGIRPKHMLNAISLRTARKQAKRLMKNRLLVGHALQFDLHVLKLNHPGHLIRDTSKFVPLRLNAGLHRNATPSLKRLSSKVLSSDIQANEHCSVEDARAAMALYKSCEEDWELDVKGAKAASYLSDVYWPSWTNQRTQ